MYLSQLRVPALKYLQANLFQGVKVPRLSCESFDELGNYFDLKCVSKKLAFLWKVLELSSKANFEEDTTKSAINRMFTNYSFGKTFIFLAPYSHYSNFSGQIAQKIKGLKDFLEKQKRLSVFCPLAQLERHSPKLLLSGKRAAEVTNSEHPSPKKRDAPSHATPSMAWDWMGRYKEILNVLDPSFNPFLIEQEILGNLSRSGVEKILASASCSDVLFLKGPYMPWWLKNLGHLAQKGQGVKGNFFQHCSQLSFSSNDQILKVGPHLFVLIRGFGTKYDEVRKKLLQYTFHDEEEEIAFSSLNRLYQLREETLESFGLSFSFITSLIDSHGIPKNCFFKYCNSKIVAKTHTCTFLQNQSTFPCQSNIGCNFVAESPMMSKAHHRLHLPNQLTIVNSIQLLKLTFLFHQT